MPVQSQETYIYIYIYIYIYLFVRRSFSVTCRDSSKHRYHSSLSLLGQHPMYSQQTLLWGGRSAHGGGSCARVPRAAAMPEKGISLTAQKPLQPPSVDDSSFLEAHPTHPTQMTPPTRGTKAVGTSKWGLINIPGPKMTMGNFSHLVVKVILFGGFPDGHPM